MVVPMISAGAWVMHALRLPPLLQISAPALTQQDFHLLSMKAPFPCVLVLCFSDLQVLCCGGRRRGRQWFQCP